MEVVVTAGAITRAKLRSNCHHQQTNTKLFYSLDALSVAKPAMSKCSVNNSYVKLEVAVLHAVAAVDVALTVRNK